MSARDRRRRHPRPEETPACCMCGMPHLAGGCTRFEHFVQLLTVVQGKLDRLLELDRKRSHRARK